MPKKIKKKIQFKDPEMHFFSISCPYREDDIWAVHRTFIGDDKLPAIDFCKEVCHIKCGEQGTIHKIEE